MDAITGVVKEFYESYPYTNLAINPGRINGGYFLNFTHIYYQVHYSFRKTAGLKILDAGCGAGDTTVILALNNPGARILALDLSQQALQAARALAEQHHVHNIEFRQGDIMEMDLGERYDFILSAGVIHHLSQPEIGLRQLVKHLEPDGIMLLFFYSMYGRWEIGLIQEIANLLEKDPLQFESKERLVRAVLGELPSQNRLKQFYNKPSMQINQSGSYFTDMYINPQEHQYNINTLYELLGQAGLVLRQFQDEQFWNIDNYLKDEFVLQKVRQLSDQEKFHLVELLFPEVMGYTFFASRNDYTPVHRAYSDQELLGLYPLINPAAFVIDDTTINIAGMPLKLAVRDIRFIPEFQGKRTISEMCAQFSFDEPARISFLGFLRSLEQAQGILFLEKPLEQY